MSLATCLAKFGSDISAADRATLKALKDSGLTDEAAIAQVLGQAEDQFNDLVGRIEARGGEIALGERGEELAPAEEPVSPPTPPSPLWSRRQIKAPRNSLGFYSALREAVENLPQESGTPEQMLATIRKSKGVKKAEIEWIGLPEWLNALETDQVSRDDILFYVSNNGVELEEIQYGGHDEGYTFTESDREPIAYDSPEGEQMELPHSFDVGAYKVIIYEEASGRDFEVLVDENAGNVAIKDLNHPGRQDLATDEPSDEYWLDVGDLTGTTMNQQDMATAYSAIRAHLSQGQDELYADTAQYPEDRWNLPGGENYQEFLLRVPPGDVMDTIAKRMGFDGWTSNLSADEQREVIRAYDAQPQSAAVVGHHAFGPSNIILSLRTKDRRSSAGPMFFLEELQQGDWIKEGRAHGYLDPKRANAARNRVMELDAEAALLAADRLPSNLMREESRWHRNRAEAETLNLERRKMEKMPPDQPFKKLAYAELGIKRLLRLAAEGNYESIGWTTGQQQIERNSLSNYVSRIQYMPPLEHAEGGTLVGYDQDETVVVRKTVKPGELNNQIGAELANNIRAQLSRGWEIREIAAEEVGIHPRWHRQPWGLMRPGQDASKAARFETREAAEAYAADRPMTAVIDDINDAVGGGGMIRFYDEIMPQMVQRLARKLDPNATVEMGRTMSGGESTEVWSLKITPEMKAGAMSGQPLWSRKGGPDRSKFMKEIPYQVAYDAHSGSSFVPEKRAVMRQEQYADQMVADYKMLSDLVRSDEEQETLDTEFEQYHQGFRKRYIAMLRADSKTMSSMITGPSNFPTRRNQKALDSAMKRMEELIEFRKKVLPKLRRALRPEQAPVTVGQADAVERIQAKIDNLTASQETMKQANRITRSIGKSIIAKYRAARGDVPELTAPDKARVMRAAQRLMDEVGLSKEMAAKLLRPDMMGQLGFPGYALTNNNSEIRRQRQRRADAEKMRTEAAQGDQEVPFDGGTVELAYEDERIRLHFDAKPDQEMRNQLKSRGFRWSRRNMAWQRQLTDNAKSVTEQILGVDLASATAVAGPDQGLPEAQIAGPTEAEEEAVERPEGARVQFSEVWQWQTPDRSGTAKYLHLKRFAADDEGIDLVGSGQGSGRGATDWQRELKGPKEMWVERIYNVLSDGKPRSFNRIVLEATQGKYHASSALEMGPDEGLWYGLERGMFQWRQGNEGVEWTLGLGANIENFWRNHGIEPAGQDETGNDLYNAWGEWKVGDRVEIRTTRTESGGIHRIFRTGGKIRAQIRLDEGGDTFRDLGELRRGEADLFAGTEPEQPAAGPTRWRRVGHANVAETGFADHYLLDSNGVPTGIAIRHQGHATALRPYLVVDEDISYKETAHSKLPAAKAAAEELLRMREAGEEYPGMEAETPADDEFQFEHNGITYRGRTENENLIVEAKDPAGWTKTSSLSVIAEARRVMAGETPSEAAEEEPEAQAPSPRNQPTLFSRRGTGLAVPDNRGLRDAYLAMEPQKLFPFLTIRFVTTDHPGVPADAEGAYFDDGIIWMVEDNLTPENFADKFRHEVFGHLAIERNPEFRPVIDQVLRAIEVKNPAVLELLQKVRQTQSDLDPEREAKEILALVAEPGVDPENLRERFKDAVRAFGRNMKIPVGPEDISENDLRQVMRLAARDLRRDGQITQEFIQARGGAIEVERLENAVEPTDEEILAAIDKIDRERRPDLDYGMNVRRKMYARKTKGWHGGSKFDEFDDAYFLTGEGAHARGAGHYFSTEESVARWYRRQAAKGIVPSMETLAEYFKPGRIVKSYGGYDRVISFNQKEGDAVSAFPTTADVFGWSVTVESVGMDRYPASFDFTVPQEGWKTLGPPRTHGTLPSAEDIQDVLGAEQGGLYQVKIPHISELPKWDQPLVKQPKSVLEKLGLSDIKQRVADYKAAHDTYIRAERDSREGSRHADELREDWIAKDMPVGHPYEQALLNKSDLRNKADELGDALYQLTGQYSGDTTFGNYYEWLAMTREGQDIHAGNLAASKFLKSKGIAGHSFLPLHSAPKHKNFVIYTAEDIEITARFSRRPAGVSPNVWEISSRTMAPAPEDLGIRDRMRKWVNKLMKWDVESFVQGAIDDAQRVRRYEEGQFGGLLDASESAYKAILNTRNLSGVMVPVMMEGSLGYRDGAFQVNPDTKGIVEIFRQATDAPEGNLLHLWENYESARRADARRSKNQSHQPYSSTDIDELLALGDQFPVFHKISQEWEDFNHQMLDLGVQSGVFDAETVELWKENPYVPWYRVMADMEEELSQSQGQGPKPTKGLSGHGAQRVKLKLKAESDLPLGNVFENMMMNTAYIIDESFKNVAMTRTAALTEGIGMTRVELPWEQVMVPNSSIKRAMENNGVQMDHMTTDQKKGWSKVFRRFVPKGRNIVSYYENGKPVFFEVQDDLLLRSVQAMGYETMQGMLDLNGLLRRSRRLLTGAVTLDPAFMLANLIRDTLSTFVVAGAPGMKPVVDAIKGAKAAFQQNEDMIQIMAAGGGGGGFYDVQPGDLRKFLTNHLGSEEKARRFESSIVHPKGLYNFWRRVSNASENANRVAVYRATRAAGGTVAEAAYQARDVLNFTMHGDHAVMRWLTMSVPFLNARVQGLYRLWRGAKSDPKGFAMRGSMVMGITLALLLRNRDRDEYDELPEWDKDTYWHVFLNPQGSPVGEADHWRIPKPFEVGILYGTMIERIYRQGTGRDSHRIGMDAMARAVGDTLAFNPIPQAVRPLAEQWANRTFFTGSPIVGYREQRLPPEFQATPWTSETARIAADALPDWAPEWVRSPRRLEHLVRGYLGATGMYVLGASDTLARAVGPYPARPDRPIQDQPVIRRFLRNPTPRTTKYADQLYTLMEETNGIFTAINGMRRDGRFAEARELREENMNMLRVRRRINSIATRVRRINAQIRRVMASQSMTPDQKRVRIDALQSTKNDVMARVAPYADL